MRRYELSIGPGDINGPFDLKASMESGQTAEADWYFGEKEYVKVVEYEKKLVKLTLSQDEGPADPELTVIVESKKPLGGSFQESVLTKLAETFSLAHDLPGFYNEFKNERALARSLKAMQGLRLLKAWDPFESLITAVLSQNRSVEGWQFTSRAMQERSGGKTPWKGLRLYPTPEAMCGLGDSGVRECKAGYRAPYVCGIAGRVSDGELDLHAVSEMTNELARSRLLLEKGVGRKVADCFLLYGLGRTDVFPVDRHLLRALSRHFLKGKEPSIPEASDFAAGKFGKWSGFVQLYLFHTARTGVGTHPSHT